MDSIVENRIKTLLPMLDEKQKRIYLATEAKGLGYGGVKAVHEITGVSMTTIIKGEKELQEGRIEQNRVRKSGGGRKRITEKYSSIKEAIENIIGNGTYGNPEKTLLWTTKSLRNMERLLREMGFDVTHDTIGNVLRNMGCHTSQCKTPKTTEIEPIYNQRSAAFQNKGRRFVIGAK